MKKIAIVLVLILLAAAGAYWTAGHYVVRSEWGLMVLEKRFLSFQDSFVNAEAWDYPDYEEHPNIMAAMREQGYADILDRMKREHEEDLEEQEDQRKKEKLQDFKDKVQSELESWKQGVMDLIPEEWKKSKQQEQTTETNAPEKAEGEMKED